MNLILLFMLFTIGNVLIDVHTQHYENLAFARVVLTLCACVGFVIWFVSLSATEPKK